MSTTFLVDTNVFVYAVTEDSPYQAGAVATLAALGAGTASAVTSVLAIEELWHHELRGRVPGLEGVTDATFRLVRPVLSVTEKILATALDIEIRGLGSNDRLLAATCRLHGIGTILTADKAFDGVPWLRRVDPADLAEVHALLARR